MPLRYKDFSECFPLWCEEQPNGAEGVFNTVSSFIETHIVVRFSPFIHVRQTQLPTPLPLGARHFFYRFRDEHKTNTNKLFEQYDVQKNVDILHQVVTDARARRQRDGGTGVDNWRADLQPRAAVRARTIPVLERERDLLRARLAEVRFCLSMSPQSSLFAGSDPLLNLCKQTLDPMTNVDGERKYGASRGGAGERGGAGAGGCQDGRDLRVF